MGKFGAILSSFVVGALLLGLFGLGMGTAIAQAPSPTFQFADSGDPLALEASALDQPLVLVLQSLVTVPLQLRVRVSNLQVEAAPGQAIRVDAPESVVVDEAAGSGEIVLAFANDEPPAPGRYTGILTVWDDESGTIVRKALQLTIPAAPACPGCAALTPAVSSWSVTVYRRYWLFGGTVATKDVLPLKQPLASNRVFAPKEAAYTSQATGGDGSLTIALSELTAAIQSDTPVTVAEIGLALQPGVTGLQPGVYKSELSLARPGAGADEKAESAVALTVTVKDHWPLPVLVLLAGIVGAWGLQNLTGPRRTLWRMNSQVAQASATFHGSADEAFKSAAGGHSWAHYSIGVDFDKKRDEIRKQLRRLHRRFFLVVDENDPGYQQAQKTLAQLQGVAAGWGAFAGQLNRLAEAVAAVERRLRTLTPPYDPAGVLAAPRFLANAKKLLLEGGGPAGVLSVAAFAPRVAQVSQFTALAEDWVELVELLGRYRLWLEAIERASTAAQNDSSTRLRQHIRRLLCEIEWDLWQAEDQADLAARGTGNDLKRVERFLSQLNCVPLELEKGLAPEAGGISSRSRGFWRIDERPDAEQVVLYARLLHFWDWAIFAALLVVAVFAVMQRQYIGQPFGTVLDYTGLALWGMGSKVALEAVNSALGRVLAPSL